MGLALVGLGLWPSWSGASTSAEARAWLERMHAAASQRSYVGTMVYSAAGQISSARVTHYCVGDQTYEHVETLDGRVQRVLRHNQAVHTVWPRERVAVLDQRDAPTAPRSPAQTIAPQALERYTVQAEGSERVAGREALVFTLRPLDELRYAHRLWADRASGLMLRADVIGPGRAVLESSAFSTIEIDVRPQPAAVLRNIRQLAGYKVLRPRVEATSLEAEGWVLLRPVEGFRPVGCLRRPLELPVPAEADPQPAQVVQQVYSDGLAQVSLFVEPFDPQRHRQALQGKLGATGTFMQRRGEHWITAMGDVPVATLRLFVEGLERRR